MLPAKHIEEHPQWDFSDDEEAKGSEAEENDKEFATESEDSEDE